MVTVTYCNYTITYCNTLLHGTGSEIVLQANMNNPIAESVPSCKLIRHWQRMLREHLGGQSILDGQISLMSVSTCVERPCILPFFANYLSMPICLRLFSFWVTTTYDRSSRLLPKCETVQPLLFGCKRPWWWKRRYSHSKRHGWGNVYGFSRAWIYPMLKGTVWWQHAVTCLQSHFCRNMD